VIKVHRSNKTDKQRTDGYQRYSASKQDKGRIEKSQLLCAVNVYFEFCYTGSSYYPASSLFSICIPYYVAKGNATLATTPVYRESEFRRSTSMYRSEYYGFMRRV
jgi:hypothetical protein